MQQFIIGNIDAIAVTVGPGLIGSLLIGVETAKTLAFVTGKPIIPVNHVLAHMYANFVNNNSLSHSGLDPESSFSKTSKDGSRLSGRDDRKIEFPAISLVVSGGHTELYLMKSMKELTWLGGTLDDAAGEAFDKTARLLGFGSRGGLAIQEAAIRHSGNPPTGGDSEIDSGQARMTKFTLPRPIINDKTLNFSFSGLKTAVLREVNKSKEAQQFNDVTIQQLSFEVQEAITDVLVAKTINAAKEYNAKSILISGGVAANLRLREKFMAHNSSFVFNAPLVSLCTDNAVYIATYAFFRGKQSDWHEITAVPDLSIEA